MNTYTLLLLSLLLMGAKAGVKNNMFFTIIYHQESSLSKSHVSLGVLAQGQYTFESNVNGWGGCGGKAAGKFSGIFSAEEMKKFNDAYKQLKEFCAQNKNCQRQPWPSNMAAWKIIGWGEHAGEVFHIKDSAQLPNLIGHALDPQLNVWQKAEEALSLKAVIKGQDLLLDFAYQGKNKNTSILEAQDAFVLIRRSGGEERLAKKGHAHSKDLNNNSNLVLKVNTKGMNIQKGDQIIYAPYATSLMPCSIIH
jgi:hypothetical protein